MKQVQRVLLAAVLVLTCFVVYQQKTEMVTMNECITGAYHNRQIISEDIDSIYGILSEKLDLSVLESCGIITNGYGHGSCVAIGSDLILTAGHCIGIPDAWVEIGGVKYEITEEWASNEYDIGFAKIEGNVPYVVLGEIPELLDEAYLVGSPYDVDFIKSITKGIISHLARDIRDWEALIQTDAEAAPGSSGGPLFNESGQVVGICVTGANPGGGVTLCEPVSHIKEALAEYQKKKVVDVAEEARRY